VGHCSVHVDGANLELIELAGLDLGRVDVDHELGHVHPRGVTSWRQCRARSCRSPGGGDGPGQVDAPTGTVSVSRPALRSVPGVAPVKEPASTMRVPLTKTASMPVASA